MVLIINIFKNLFGKKKQQEEAAPVIERKIELFTGDTINVQKDEAVAKQWKGVIHSATDEHFTVDIPELMEEFPFPFREGQNIIISVSREGKVARFSSKLVKIAWKRKPPIILLEHPEQLEWQDVVERKHIRINTDLPAKVRRNQDEEWLAVRVNDFSIAGLSFLSPSPFMKDEELIVQIMSMDFRSELTGFVTRAQKLEERSSGDTANYSIGIKFNEMSEIDKHSATNFAHKLQRMSGEAGR
ncbi:MAG: flagellar brake protein [Firmicutes bacterium]|nr:flagellar brake protein [Bacillota bacterium]